MRILAIVGTVLCIAAGPATTASAAGPEARASGPAAASGSAAVAGTFAPHGMGGLPPTFRIKASATRSHALGIAADESLPASVDLSGNSPTPGDQGLVGSCAAWSIGYTQAGWYANASGHAGAPFAPMYVYSQTHADNSASGGGSYTSADYAVLVSQGIAEKRVYAQGNFDFRTLPTSAERANAATHKISSYDYLFTGARQGSAGVQAIKTALANNTPVGIGIPVYPPFMYLDSSDYTFSESMKTDSPLGYHAITAVGYDTVGLIIENSWGTGWGRKGYGRLAWDFVQAEVDEAAVMTGFAPSGTPAGVTGLSANRFSTAGGTALTITGTLLGTVDATAKGAVQLVNVADPTLEVNAPVTRRTTSSLTVTAPAVSAAGAWRVVVNNSAGGSQDVAADDVTYVVPLVVSPAGGGTVPATGSWVTLNGNGFGATEQDYTDHGVAPGLIDGVHGNARWVSDTQLQVWIGPGAVGSVVRFGIYKDGVSSPRTTTVRGAAVGAASWSTNPQTGVRLGTLTGRGLAGSRRWTLTPPSGPAVSVPTLANVRLLAKASIGVVVISDTKAYVHVPAHPGVATGTWRLRFTPAAGSLADTPALRVAYGG